MARKTGNERSLFQALNELGNTHRRSRNLDVAEEYYQEARTVAQQMNGLREQLSVLNNLGIIRLIPLGLIANEVITNAMKYAFVDRNEGKLQVSFRRSGEDIELLIADDGPGQEVNLTGQPDSFGNLLVRTFAEQLNGSLRVTGEEGTRVKLRFPIQKRT